jgi:hypothetical protein
MLDAKGSYPDVMRIFGKANELRLLITERIGLAVNMGAFST